MPSRRDVQNGDRDTVRYLGNTAQLKCHSCGYDFICLYLLFSGYHSPPSIPDVSQQRYSNSPLYNPKCQCIKKFSTSKILLISFSCCLNRLWGQVICKMYFQLGIGSGEVFLFFFLFCLVLFLKNMPSLSLWTGVQKICIFIHQPVYNEEQK